ncbi:MAG: hypothetical protein OEZ39_07675 [Gammaproteobacteria bacterium]|nr:hypothetical protein [Gammaproteobacteria bacterium]MDH5651738.1 hypothetical protein [Gammaproteobacteria bacterium]
MKKRVLSLSLCLTLFAVEASAGSYNPSASGILSGKEKCASALNSYLYYRHNSSDVDHLKLQKLEYQIDAMCEGYQVRLVNKDGALTGIVEAAE